MFKQFVQQVQGADFWMISSLVIFMTFFAGVSIYLLTADKKKLKDSSEIPLK